MYLSVLTNCYGRQSYKNTKQKLTRKQVQNLQDLPQSKVSFTKMQLWWTGLITFWFEDHDFLEKLYTCVTRLHTGFPIVVRAKPLGSDNPHWRIMQFFGKFWQNRVLVPSPPQELANKPRGNPASATESYFWKHHQNKNKTVQVGGGDNEEAFHVFTLSESIQTIKHDIATGKLSDNCTHTFIRGIQVGNG